MIDQHDLYRGSADRSC